LHETLHRPGIVLAEVISVEDQVDPALEVRRQLAQAAEVGVKERSS
jgi:hypothetical protein